MKYPSIIFITIATIMLFFSGCGLQSVTHTQASIEKPKHAKPNHTKAAKRPPSMKKNDTISLAVIGEHAFTGRPSTPIYFFYSTDINLAKIQKKALHTILKQQFPHIIDKGNQSQILTEITDFSYKWPALSLTSNAVVSFTLTIQLKTNEGLHFTKAYRIDEYEGKEHKLFLTDPLSEAISDTLENSSNERSQLVSQATFEALQLLLSEHMDEILTPFNESKKQ
ncbi:MAG: hypothetical protein HQM07_02270 [Zetaproteobacteria bacterium]|nr:hypothetical protein [Zetaproteobacteria bacterium]